MGEPFDHLKSALADRYLLERELGAGGMASVFLAHDPRHNRKVAIKVMHPDLAALIGPERFLKEIETTANLHHPHILPLFDSGRVEGTVFYVMPYVQGESLRARLDRETQLPVADAIRITAEIAAGLDYAHRHGVIHRDIKPDNVLFHDGRALVADFGIALAWSDGDGRKRLTRSGVSLGTPQYMSPEQVSGEHKLDGAAAFDVSENGTLAYLPVSSYITETDLVLVDRRGNESRALPASDRYNHPRLSPEGGRLAVDIRSANSSGDVWVFQVGGSGGTRVTAEGGRDFGAEWTPDGQELIYISEHPFFDLYRRAADASRPAEPLLTGGYDRYTGSVSQDGRLLAFVLSVSGGVELWTVQLRGRPEPTRYLANGFNLAHPTLSPDGRWMAYDSDESGQVEVFAQSFPNPNLKRWKVSRGHGSEPLWTRGGRELVYRNGDSVMAVSIDLENGRSGQPTALFAGPYPDNPGWTRPRSYDVSRDGERFLMTRLPADQSRPRIVVVLNWFDELRAKVPR
jgi:serine/threonine protein kinase